MGSLIDALFIFMLAAFIGFEVIRRVSPLLHTPLMSLTNALDAIAVVGAIVLVGEHKSTLSTVLGSIVGLLRRVRERHVEVEADDSRFPVVLFVLHRMIEGRPGGDDRTPVSALHAVGPPIVELVVDELMPQRGDGAGPDRTGAAVLSDRRTGKAVSRQ